MVIPFFFALPVFKLVLITIRFENDKKNSVLSSYEQDMYQFLLMNSYVFK